MLIDFVLIYGMIVCLIVIFLILKKKEFSMYLLLPFIFYSLFGILCYYSYCQQINWLNTITLCLCVGLGFYASSIIYLFVKSLLFQKKNIKNEIVIHLIVFRVLWISYIMPYRVSTFFNDFSLFKKVKFLNWTFKLI